MSLLDTVIDTVDHEVRAGGLAIVVLDLDSTAISTAARQLRILQEFASERGESRLSALVDEVREAELGYRVEAVLERRGYADASALSALRAFWRARFFTDAYCALDQASEGAVDFARRVSDAGGLLYYLTARPAQMALGTLSVLRDQGFPTLDGRAVLHMKPDGRRADHGFKRAAMERIVQLRGRVVASFENEPAHAAAFLERFPRARHFLVGDVRSPDAPDPHPDLVQIPSFRV